MITFEKAFGLDVDFFNEIDENEVNINLDINLDLRESAKLEVYNRLFLVGGSLKGTSCNVVLSVTLDPKTKTPKEDWKFETPLPFNSTGGFLIHKEDYLYFLGQKCETVRLLNILRASVWTDQDGVIKLSQWKTVDIIPKEVKKVEKVKRREEGFYLLCKDNYDKDFLLKMLIS